MPTKTTDNPTLAPAWAWVLSHATLIDRVAWTFVRGTSLTHEDYRAELIADLASMHAKYDPARAGATTWIWLRAARVRRTMVRAAVRGSGAPLDDRDALPVGSAGHDERTSARAEVVSILDRATPIQRMAALSVLRGWSRDEVRSRLALSIPQRDALVRTLADGIADQIGGVA